MKTIIPKENEIAHKWYLIDGDGQTLGRLAVRVASLLKGKGKPQYTPHINTGDSVIVINAEKVVVTGRKRTDKLYYRHSGYPGGLRVESFQKAIARKPTFPLEHAVKGMLPKNRLGRRMFNNCKIYAGPNHPHASQKPETIEL
jgi:large subunit ribosomal protein L13